MKYAEKQMLHSALQALYRHAEIVSGAYKHRRTQRGVEPENYEKYVQLGLLTDESVREAREHGTFPFRDLSDDEKLDDALGIMQRHIATVRECMDHEDKP
jgi:hypothetical protein